MHRSESHVRAELVQQYVGILVRGEIPDAWRGVGEHGREHRIDTGGEAAFVYPAAAARRAKKSGVRYERLTNLRLSPRVSRSNLAGSNPSNSRGPPLATAKAKKAQ